VAPSSVPDERKREALRRVWREARPIIVGDPVHAYLQWRRLSLPLPDMPTVLRYHPHLAYTHDNGQRTYHPAMVALVQAPDGTSVSLHRTYLTRNGHKADVLSPKKLMSPAVPGATRGGAIRLYPVGETLTVAEGIETGLAVRVSAGLPIWVTLSAGNMRGLMVPQRVQLLVICADHDLAGLDAAKALARRMLAEGRRVKILAPDLPGTDWADTLEVCHA
jgi:putative DNA primase/helicase